MEKYYVRDIGISYTPGIAELTVYWDNGASSKGLMLRVNDDYLEMVDGKIAIAECYKDGKLRIERMVKQVSYSLP